MVYVARVRGPEVVVVRTCGITHANESFDVPLDDPGAWAVVVARVIESVVIWVQQIHKDPQCPHTHNSLLSCRPNPMPPRRGLG